MRKKDDITFNCSGIGLGGLLAVVFITLRLTGYIDWSWWWVLAPIWIPWVMVLIVSAITGFFFLMAKWTRKF